MIDNELFLLETDELRNNHMKRINTLNKAKKISTLSNSNVLLTRMVADYYEVGIEVIKVLYNRNKEELENNGVLTLKWRELKDFKLHLLDREMLGSASALTVFNLKSVMAVSFYLSKSEVAKKVREEIVRDAEFSKEFHSLIVKQNNSLMKENEVERLLKNTFGGFLLVERSVSFKKYYLDFVLTDKSGNQLVVECDEYGHSNYNEKEELNRESDIKESFDLIRYNPDSGECISLLLNKILLHFVEGNA